jgi:hypothetical protein
LPEIEDLVEVDLYRVHVDAEVLLRRPRLHQDGLLTGAKIQTVEDSPWREAFLIRPGGRTRQRAVASSATWAHPVVLPRGVLVEDVDSLAFWRWE